MSEVNRESLEAILPQLKCHFTWNLFREGSMSSHMEDRVCNQVEHLNSEEKATMYDLLAYIKHLDGESKAALECLGQAEDLRKSEHNDQSEIRRLVTWGNYAWIYYHMGRLSEAQAYVDKVRQVCQKFANPYSMECPELECEEGWTRLKCGRNERAKMCFEKALEEKPKDPECSSGMAIAMFRLEEKPEKQFSVDALKQAMELNPQNQYLKVLLALKLLRMGEEAEGERLIKDALGKAPNQTDVLQKAAQFYKKKGNLDRAIELLGKALRSTVNNSPLYSLVMCRYREILEQLQNKGDADSSERRQRMAELRRLTMEFMQKTLQRRRSPLNSYSDLIDFPEVERCYQMVISKESPDVEEEDLYERYCNLQEYHRKSEDLAALECLLQFPRNERSIEPGQQRPPTPETDYPELLASYPEEDYSPVGSFSDPGPASPLVAPPGWSCQITPDKQMLYTNQFTQEQWVRLEDQHGKPYFYNPEDSSVQWELPQVPIPAPRSVRKSSQDSDTPAQASPPEEKIKTLDKAGVLHRTKTVDKGKRLR